MHSRFLAPVLVVGLGLTALATIPLPAAAPPSTKTIAQLISEMSSSTYAERQAAYDALDAIGAPALPELRKALDSGNAEVRKKALALLTQIEKRTAIERILAPKMVHLVYNDKPLNEALNDFRAKSGYSIILHDPTGRLAARKVTLDTGNTTFWDALEQFCVKADLIEGDPTAAPPPPGGFLPPPPPRGFAPPPPPIAVPRPALKKAAGGAAAPAPAAARKAAVKVALKAVPAPGIAIGMPGMGGPGMPGMVGAIGQITLIDGKVKGEPTDYRTAVRVRALSGDRRFGAARAGEALLTLQISPEPKLRWQRLLDVKIDRAIDDKSQALREPMPEAPAPGTVASSSVPGGAVAFGGGGGAVVFVRGGMSTSYSPYGIPNIPLHHYTSVRLRQGAVASKLLKELTGVITAEVLTETTDLMVVKDVLKAKGKTVTGKDGGKFKIHEVTVNPGQVVIRFDFVPEPGAVAEAPQVNMLWNVVPAVAPVPVPVPAPARPRPIRRGGPAVPKAAPAGGAGLALPVKAPAIAAPLPVAVPALAVMRVRSPYGYNNNNGVSLRDEKGNILPTSLGMIFNGGAAPEYQLVYTPQPGHGKVASLVFSGRRNVSVSIPFTLKDVRLP